MVSICARKRTIIFSKWYAKFQKSDWQLHLFIRTGAAFPIQRRMKWNTNVVLFIPYGKLFLTDDFDSVIADGPISSKYQNPPLCRKCNHRFVFRKCVRLRNWNRQIGLPRLSLPPYRVPRSVFPKEEKPEGREWKILFVIRSLTKAKSPSVRDLVNVDEGLSRILSHLYSAYIFPPLLACLPAWRTTTPPEQPESHWPTTKTFCYCCRSRLYVCASPSRTGKRA